MTPRESLEAADHPSIEMRLREAGFRTWIQSPGFWYDKLGYQFTEDEALAQLARDEAKATSDGQDGCSSTRLDGGDRNSPLDTVVPDKAAPVATSVSAPDFWEKWAQGISNSNYGIVSKATMFKFADAYASEYASSSSAALLAANEVIRRQLKKVCDQARAAEAKVAELRGQLEVREILAAADLAKLKELEDNSTQDEREIEALQESLRTVRQDLADRDGIIIGLQDVAAGKTRPLTDIEAELRGNKS